MVMIHPKLEVVVIVVVVVVITQGLFLIELQLEIGLFWITILWIKKEKTFWILENNDN